MQEPVASFATLEEADTFHASSLYGLSWESENGGVRQRALNTATRLLYSYVPLSAETLASPPQSLKNATSELARILILHGDPAAPSETAGLRSLTAGPVKLDFATPAEGKDRRLMEMVIPAEVLAMIGHLILEVEVGLPFMRNI